MRQPPKTEENMSNKLWDKGFSPDKMVEKFTVGADRQLDLLMARHDVIGSKAHITMLCKIGLLSEEELAILQTALDSILHEIDEGEFVIEDDVEDIHSQVELMLTRRLGPIGKKIHSGRSRNDQVLVDLKLFMRDEIMKVVSSCKALFNKWIELSDKYKDILMPGYTHFQIAMPSSFGLWFGAYAETLVDDLRLLASAYDIVNQNPLGSAAGYGSSFPLDREMTTRLLNFGDMHYNVVAAQMSRGKSERAVAVAIAAIASTLGRFAMDCCLYCSQNYGFISFPDEFTTGSSIMPHKKNPDSFEIMRGKCNRLQSVPNELSLMVANLPHGYHRDNQLLKDVIFPVFPEIISSIDMCLLMLEHIRINPDILSNKQYEYLFTVEEVNRLTLTGIPFREAYKIVSDKVRNGTFESEHMVHHTHVGSIGNLSNDKIREKMNNVLAKFPSL